MTKKILAVVMGVLLVVSAFMFTACGSAFDGKYSEVTKEEVQTFASSVESNEIDKNANGVKLSYSYEYKELNYEKKISVSTTTIIENEKLSGEFKFNNYVREGEVTETTESAVYLKDGAHYLSNKKTKNGTDVSTSKIKYESTLSYEGAMVKLLGVLSSLTIPSEGWYSLSNVLLKYSNAEGVTFYMDTTNSEVTKVKINLPKKDGATAQSYGEIYFVFDANKCLTGFKMEKTDVESDGETKTTYVVETNTKGPKFPSDLGSYQA